MTDYIEFSAKIKEKYPQYADVDDRVLAEKMIEKYPEYKEQVTFDVEETSKKTPEKKGFWDYDNEDFKADYQKLIDDRKKWEEKHPIISGMQKDLQPNYRSNLADWELKAKYGIDAPLKEQLKTDIKKLGQDLIPAINLTTAAATGGGAGIKELLPRIGNFAKAGAIQGGVAGGLHELGENGLSPEVAKNAAKGTVAGALIGTGTGALTGVGDLLANIGKKGIELTGRVGQIKPETLQQVIKPESQALEMTSDDATNALLDITRQVRENFNKLRASKGEAVDKAIKNLPEDTPKFELNDLLNDIKGAFDNYQLDKANPARSLAGGLEDDLSSLIKPLADDTGLVSPLSLQGAKKTIGQMGKWGDETARGYVEPITEQVYGKFANRLNELSPDVKAANKAFSDLMAFKKNDTVSQILKGDLLNEGKLGGATSALKAYKSTINKGSGQENLKNLENLLVKENLQQPFLNKIDDINAAMDLLKTENTGIGGIASLAKTLLTRPALTAARAVNRANVPQKIQNIKDTVAPIAKLLPPLGVNGVVNLLYGGVEHNDYR